MHPSCKRLLQSNEEVPRPELAAVCVSRELQVKSRLQRSGRGSWLMRQQNSHDIVRCTGNGCRGIAAMRFIKVVSAVIRDPGNYQRVVVMPEDHVLIEQHVYSEAAQLGHPRSDAAVILMVAGDEVRSVA